MGSLLTPYWQTVKGSCDLLLKFGTPSIFWEQFEIETSNLASRLITGSTNDKNAKLGQRGSGRGHVTYFWNFGTPFISLERFVLETLDLACRFTTTVTNEKNVKLGQSKLTIRPGLAGTVPVWKCLSRNPERCIRDAKMSRFWPFRAKFGCNHVMSLCSAKN